MLNSSRPTKCWKVFLAKCAIWRVQSTCLKNTWQGQPSFINPITRYSLSTQTKHYQTLFLSPDIRLVDCPGLVLPSQHEMEAQVLAGILPISRVSAVPACIHHAARLLPLERIFDLKHPSASAPPVEDKRTWRAGTGPKLEQRTPRWTAMDILIAYAEKKGWLTAKAGRPDVHRAGNASA